MSRPPYETGFRKGRVPSKHQRVYRVLLTGAPDLWGFSICQRARVGSGSMYPLLARLERLGWLGSEWEVLGFGEDRPRRRFYSLTPLGRQRVTELLGLESPYAR